MWPVVVVLVMLEVRDIPRKSNDVIFISSKFEKESRDFEGTKNDTS